MRLALLAAVGMVGFNLAVIAAERAAEPAVPGVLVGCAPVVVAVVVPLMEGRRPRRLVLYGAWLVAAGALAVQGWGRTDGAGIAFSLCELAGEVGFAVLAVPVLRPLGPRLLSATVCGIAAVESAAADCADFGPLFSAFFEVSFGQAAAVAFGATAVSSEFQGGALGVSLAAVPQRGRWFAAKAVAVGVPALAVGLVTGFVSPAVGKGVLGDKANGLTWTEGLRRAAGCGVYLALMALAAAGLAASSSAAVNRVRGSPPVRSPRPRGAASRSPRSARRRRRPGRRRRP